MSDSHPTWRANGLLFENCNCTAVCPGHVHFSQPCTHEVCHGFWAIRIDDGIAGDVDLSGLDAVVVYESPQVMIDGGWRQTLLVSEAATDAQRDALETIIGGTWGGPWEVLARFVDERRPTRSVPIHISDERTSKSLEIPGILRSVVEAIRGRDRSEPVVFQNIYNQVHDAHQVIARGTSDYDDGEVVIRTDGTHGLWSSFNWSNTAEGT